MFYIDLESKQQSYFFYKMLLSINCNYYCLNLFHVTLKVKSKRNKNYIIKS